MILFLIFLQAEVKEYRWDGLMVRAISDELDAWLEILDEGRVLFDSRKYCEEHPDVWMYNPIDVRVLDMDGDGENELYVEFYSGGAHCCSSAYVFERDDEGVKIVADVFSGNSGISIEDADGDGDMEIVVWDDALAYDFTPYVATPWAMVVLSRDEDSGVWRCSPGLTRLYNTALLMEEKGQDGYGMCVFQGETCVLYSSHLDRAMKMIYAGRVEDAREYILRNWMGRIPHAFRFWKTFVEELKGSQWAECIFGGEED